MFKIKLTVKGMGRERRTLYLVIPSYVAKFYSLNAGKKINAVCRKDKIVLYIK